MQNKMPIRNIKHNDHAEPGSSGKRRHTDNFKLALGIGVNWIDMDTGIMYHIQDYADALHDRTIPEDKKPTKIRTTRVSDGAELGWVDAYLVEERMKDPEPDPRY